MDKPTHEIQDVVALDRTRCDEARYACHHPELEGVFVALHDEDVEQLARLDQHFFYGPKWQGHCYNGIDQETADFLDALLAASPVTRCIAVDRDRLLLSHEAWVHVLFECGDGADETGRFAGFGRGRGILTWPNSD